jgi:hypothetical protein
VITNEAQVELVPSILGCSGGSGVGCCRFYLAERLLLDLGRPAIPHLRMTELVLEHPERMLDRRTQARQSLHMVRLPLIASHGNGGRLRAREPRLGRRAVSGVRPWKANAARFAEGGHGASIERFLADHLDRGSLQPLLTGMARRSCGHAQPPSGAVALNAPSERTNGFTQLKQHHTVGIENRDLAPDRTPTSPTRPAVSFQTVRS